MTDDRIVKDTARDPEREALGSTRGGVRAAAGKVAKKAAKKITRKAVRKETAKKTAAAGRTTKKTVAVAGKTAKAAAKRDKPAPPRVDRVDTSAPEAVATVSGTPKVSATGSRAASARATAASRPAGKGAAARKSAATRAASAAETPPDAAAPGNGSAANAPAAPVVPLPGPGASAEAPRPPAPMHPGAYTDSTQEQSGGGLGSLLALWGPLIIVGFLVLVFRGGAERASAVAAGPDAQARSAAADTPAQIARGPEGRDAIGSPAGAQAPERAPGPPGAGRVVAEAFDRGFAMRTSMAGGPPFAGREPGAPMPAGSPGRLYPTPPGPYRDPRYGLPADEHWTAGGAGDWTRWSAGGRTGSGEEGGDMRVEWVRCAPPYHWCPAPGNPTW